MTEKTKKISELNRDNTHISKPFLSTLIDAVLFAKYASQTEDLKLNNLLVKACIIHCSFTVEALANNMIQFINLGGKLSESIDKMDVVSKMEIFSLLTKKHKIDRGSYAVQVFQDLMDIRNKYAHPKIRKSGLVNNKGKLSRVPHKHLSQLNLSREMSEWTVDDSNMCVLALLKSIDHFLLDELSLEMKSMSCMFMDFLSIEGISGPIVPSEIDWSNWTQVVLKYKPKFYCDHILKRYKI